MSEPTPTECSPFYTKKGHTTRHTCAHDDVVGEVITLQLILMTKNLAILSPTDLLKIREKICITTREGTRLVRQTSPATPHIKRRRFNLRSLLNFTLQTPHSYICPAWDSHMSIVSVGLYNYFLTNFTEISKSSRVLLIMITKTAFCRKYFVTFVIGKLPTALLSSFYTFLFRNGENTDDTEVRLQCQNLQFYFRTFLPPALVTLRFLGNKCRPKH